MHSSKTLALGFTALTLMLTACAANTDDPPADEAEQASTITPPSFKSCTSETSNGLDMYSKASLSSTRTGGAPLDMALRAYCKVTTRESGDWIAVTYPPHGVAAAPHGWHASWAQQGEMKSCKVDPCTNSFLTTYTFEPIVH